MHNTSSDNDFYRDVAATYDQLFTGPADLRENDVIRAAAGRLLYPLLDIGCGTGFFLDQGFSPGHYYGLDASVQMLNTARDKHRGARFVHGDMHDLPFEDNSFNAVVSLWSLSYSGDLARAATEISRVLRPGGNLLVAVYGQWEDGTSPLAYEEVDSYCPSDRRLFTAAEFSGYLRNDVGLVDVLVRGLTARTVPALFPGCLSALYHSVVGALSPDSCWYLLGSGVNGA